MPYARRSYILNGARRAVPRRRAYPRRRRVTYRRVRY